ncbi:hypothetical protein CHCC20335_1201 [Bacillus paralicheniformis]|nr:hypothetical protein CHCC20335_1201 [Bacillus paralicheniformis]
MTVTAFIKRIFSPSKIERRNANKKGDNVAALFHAVLLFKIRRLWKRAEFLNLSRWPNQTQGMQ